MALIGGQKLGAALPFPSVYTSLIFCGSHKPAEACPSCGMVKPHAWRLSFFKTIWGENNWRVHNLFTFKTSNL